MNDQTTDALNRVAAQLARVAAAIESSTTYTPRHAAPTLTPTYAIDDPTGGDTWDSMSDALAEISTWDEGARREALDAGFIVRWQSPWLPVEEHVTPPDVEHSEHDRKLRVWTFEDLESLPIGWTVRDRDGDPWEKAGYRGDGTSMWRPGDSDSLPRSSEALMRWMNPVNVAGMTVKELAAAADGTRVVDSLNDTWRKEGDKFVHVQWPSAAPVTPETLRQYGPILEATV